MADIRLGRYEIEHYDPPPVCVRCGARSVVCKDHRFQWSPPWVYVLLLLGVIPYAIAAGATQKRMTVPMPLCDRHKWHWGGRTAVVLLGLVAIIAILIMGVALGAELDADPALIFIPVGFLFLAWIVSAIVLASTTIRAREITDKSITLMGISPEFIEALNEARRGERDDEEDDDRPRRRRRRDEEDEDDDRPRRRRRDEDEEQKERPRAGRRGAEDDGGYFDPDDKRPRKQLPPDAYEEADDHH
jgi:hypothetical protein